MQKSRWIIASAALAVGIGLSHAGCYTSGIPGGPAAGGGTSTGDESSISPNADGGPVDAAIGEDGSAGKPECASTFDCKIDEVCDTEHGKCVECNIDAECDSRACNPDTHQCVQCLATTNNCGNNERCALNECITTKACFNVKDCRDPNHEQVCGTSGYCVDCEDDSGCKQTAPGACGDGQCTCQDGLCVISGKPIHTSDAG